MHMSISKRTSLEGQEMMGLVDEKAQALGFKLSAQLLEKLGPYKQNYYSCVTAQNRYDLTCAKYSNTEKEHGNVTQVKGKLNKIQNYIDAGTERINQINTVFKAMESEYQTFIQEQNVTHNIPLLKSTVNTNKPLMDVLQMNDLTNIVVKCTEKIDDLFSKHHDLGFMSQVIGQVLSEMTKIQTSLEKFQPMELLVQCMKVLNKNVYDAHMIVSKATKCFF